MSKKKKIVIILSTILVALIGLVVTLSLTTFSLKKISVDFRTSTLNLTATEEEIISSGDFSKSCVFFYNKDRCAKKIEEAYPYIKVINIETKYPNSFVIHVSERQEVYMLQSEDKTYFLDEELKVLNISDELVENTQSNSILLKGLNVENSKIGDYIKGDYVDIYSAFLQSNWTLGMQKEIFKEIEFKWERDDNLKKEELNAYIYLFSGQTIKIADVNYGLKYKASRAYSVYSSLYTFIGKDYTKQDGTSVTLTKEMLDDVTITIQSYYDRNHHKESETYILLDFA